MVRMMRIPMMAACPVDGVVAVVVIRIVIVIVTLTVIVIVFGGGGGGGGGGRWARAKIGSCHPCQQDVPIETDVPREGLHGEFRQGFGDFLRL